MKKIVSILLILTIFSSLFLLTACDDSNADNTNIIPGKANYVYFYAPKYRPGGYIVNAEKLNDNYYLFHLVDKNSNEDVVLTHKNNVRYTLEKTDDAINSIIKNTDALSKKEMISTLLKETEHYKDIYASGNYLTIEFSDEFAKEEGTKIEYTTSEDECIIITIE